MEFFAVNPEIAENAINSMKNLYLPVTFHSFFISSIEIKSKRSNSSLHLWLKPHEIKKNNDNRSLIKVIKI